MKSVTLIIMEFAEKLRRLTNSENKAKLAREAGLKPTVISSYIATGSIPRADIAVKMAKAVGVPIEWLVDNERDWPPPPREPSTEELVSELGRRMSETAVALLAKLIEAEETTDWIEVAQELLRLDPRTASRSNLPPLADLPSQIRALESDLRTYAPVTVIKDVPPDLAEHVRPGYTFNLLDLVERFGRLYHLPGYVVAVQLASLLAMPDRQWVADNSESIRRWAKQALDRTRSAAAAWNAAIDSKKMT